MLVSDPSKLRFLSPNTEKIMDAHESQDPGCSVKQTNVQVSCGSTL